MKFNHNPGKAPGGGGVGCPTSCPCPRHSDGGCHRRGMERSTRLPMINGNQNFTDNGQVEEIANIQTVLTH